MIDCYFLAIYITTKSIVPHFEREYRKITKQELVEASRNKWDMFHLLMKVIHDGRNGKYNSVDNGLPDWVDSDWDHHRAIFERSA